VKPAHPDKTVIGFTGDGGAMYTIHALWSAARHGVAAKFVVRNNGSYKLLELNSQAHWKEQNIARHDSPLSFDLSKPVLRFDKMAESLSVRSVRIEQPDRLVRAKSRCQDIRGHS
jgi:benzoylformate decarboxylase